MKNKKIIILIIVGIGAVISLVYGIKAKPKRGAKVSLKYETKHPAKEIQPAKRIIPQKRKTKRSEFTSWNQDPFASKVTPSGAISGSKPALEGIMWSERNPKAMIGNEIVEKGDKIDGNTVVDIKRDRVILNNGTKNFTLKLGD